MKTCHLCLAAAALALFSPVEGGAQIPGQRRQPRIGFVYPAGGQQGTTFIVSVGGLNLDRASAGYFTGTGVTAKIAGYERPLPPKEFNELREQVQTLQKKQAAARADPKNPPFTAQDEKLAREIRQTLATRGNRQATPALAETVTLELAIAADAPTGEREIRLQTSNGLSNPLVFCVGQLPEVSAPVVTALANRSSPRERAPGPANARSNRPKGEMELSLPVLVNGQILPGEVDRFRFTARKGQRITVAVTARALIPYLADAVPGWFQAAVKLSDAAGRELAYSDDFRFSPDPALVCEIPADGVYVVQINDALHRGREDFVYRLALGELPFVTSIFPLGGRPGHDTTLALTGWNLARNTLALEPSDKTAGVFPLSNRPSGGFSNFLRFALDTESESVAVEPNDLPENAQPVAPPIVVNGRIGRSGDEDVFQFEGKAGQEIVAEVFARRLGSPLDSVMTVADASGRKLAVNDDCDDPAEGLLTHQADSRIALKLPADGRYTVHLADAQQQGGAEFGYRLRLGPPRPNFELRVAPSTINVRAKASVPITVYALRRDGFSGEITLGLADGPHGFALSGARIPANQDKVQFTLTAPPLPRDEPFVLNLVGQGTIEGRTVVHTAVPADDMMQAFAYRHLVPAGALAVSVTGRGAELKLLSEMPVRIPLGGTARVRIAVPAARAPDLQFELSQPSPEIKLASHTGGPGYREIELTCDAAATRVGSQGNLLLHAFDRRPDTVNRNPSMQPAPFAVVPAIAFEVVESHTASPIRAQGKPIAAEVVEASRNKIAP